MTSLPDESSGRVCPACDGDVFRPLVVVRETPIRQCATCGLATWDWEGFDAGAFYDASYWQSNAAEKGYADYHSLADAMQHTNFKRLKWLVRRLGDPGHTPRLLDVGCGPGYFVQAASDVDLEASGVEVSEYAVRFAREELGQDVRRGEARAADLGSGPYELVTMWDVIEHLPDPAGALRDVAAVTAPGGLVALSTGDVSSMVARVSGARWHLYTFPEHLWFFTPASLRRLMERAGLEVVETRYEVCWYPVSYLVERVGAMFGRRCCGEWLGMVGRVPVPVSLFDIVTVVGRKVG